VLLVDDEALVRAGLRMILETADDVTVIGEAEDGRAAIDAVGRDRPDVVLMDIRMPKLDGLAATAAIRARPQPPAVVVLTTFDSDDEVFRALEAGATGFLLKDTPPAELLRAVRLAAAGDSMLSPTVTRRVITRFTAEDRTNRRRDALDRLRDLTEREREVLVEIGRGHANAEIAKVLFMSEATVKTHVSHLFEKLSVTNRVQLAIAAFRAGLVD
jgi:DNA-binding NarL/FixJ family response regulator